MPISVCDFDLASDRTVHLRTPKDTSVGKVMESCLRMLGINEDKDHFNMKSNEGLYIKAKKYNIYKCCLCICMIIYPLARRTYWRHFTNCC